MIKPIDTQILYPQTPEIAGRQHKTNQLPLEQQVQFGDIVKKEVEQKRETILETNKSEHLKTQDNDESKKFKNMNHQKKHKNKKPKDKENNVKKSTNRIDIRI